MLLTESYRTERRLMEMSDFLREDLGTVVRYSPLSQNVEGLVCFANIPHQLLDEEIQRHIAHFDGMNIGFEWKVYDSDEPACLRDKLIEAGFQEGEAESLMVYDTSEHRPAVVSELGGIMVRRIEHTNELNEVVDLQETIWDRSFSWLFDQLLSIWNHGTFYGAYDNERLVGAGWIEYPPGAQFAELHGGSVLPAFRGRGIYSQLLHKRLSDALVKGVRWVAVDAAPMSRPILEAKGLKKLDTTYPMAWLPRGTTVSHER
ncbi:GNAT family N-acetyltransferase [Marinimicrobium sp. ABcell2]|uniref:GNAT family N-acetyltransferase n=1 Tax=Marinimicrobium sp. ABcell2 TaxID=3069751 RepID=UPI0027AEBED1|nr:GNAT family N-acetyltransferase [Marinimicrobium sp. ABcell2]MDQ2076254.1 GNAT family N-acetyltransferase [Marinimicrobium sp. ABcell2]